MTRESHRVQTSEAAWNCTVLGGGGLRERCPSNPGPSSRPARGGLSTSVRKRSHLHRVGNWAAWVHDARVASAARGLAVSGAAARPTSRPDYGAVTWVRRCRRAAPLRGTAPPPSWRRGPSFSVFLAVCRGARPAAHSTGVTRDIVSRQWRGASGISPSGAA